MDKLDRIIIESINKVIFEKEENNNNSTEKENKSRNKTLDSNWDNINDSDRAKNIKRYRRSTGNVVSDGERQKLKKEFEDNFINVAAVAHEVYPDHTDEGGQSQLEKQLNGDRPLRTKTYRQIQNVIGFDR